MSVVSVVLGAQWGDEGKGKLVDLLAEHAEIVARCQVIKETLIRDIYIRRRWRYRYRLGLSIGGPGFEPRAGGSE